MKTSSEYAKGLKDFIELASGYRQESQYSHSIECMFESLADWSQLHSIDTVRKWFLEKRDQARIIVTEIGLKDLDGWNFDDRKGVIVHESGDFFKINGISASSDTREKKGGWDQPIVTQIGFDGGLLGLVRKRFSGIPHYLCEAKEEPGNYGKAQISPTLQATFANINRAHKGRKPHFLDLFESELKQPSGNILFDSWVAEDGGRLYLKRNRAMLIEVAEQKEILCPSDNFIWLSLYQIKELLTEDAWVNPHIRSILAHV